MIPASIYLNFPALHSCTLPGRRSLLRPLAAGLDALEKQPGIGARVVVGAAGCCRRRPWVRNLKSEI